MNFFKMFLRGMALLPSVIQGVERLYGAKAGARKRAAAMSIVAAAINVAEASEEAIVDSARFTAALGMIVDGVVGCLNASLWSKSA